MHHPLTLLAALLLCTAWAPAQTRTAFLGDSITAGQGTGDTPEQKRQASYPAVARRLLGPGYTVRAFGAHGRALRGDARQVYADSNKFKRAVKFRPDLAVIMLGTNDSAVEQPMMDWQGSLQRLLVPLREANPDVRVLLASPPDMFPEAAVSASGSNAVEEQRREWLTARRPRLEVMTEALRDLARETDGVDFVDTRGTLRPRDVTDGVHPNAFGAERLAYRIAGAILTLPEPGATAAEQPWQKVLAARPDAVESSFHGFARVDFALGEAGSPACTIVAPDWSAAGHPWIWRARFFGHQPALDVALLKRGFHLAYVDVAGLFGGPAAVARMGEFHAMCERIGLGPKPVLEGMSRGGLAAFEYAKANPARVAAVYADNPVADIRSWPGGRSGKRSDEDWEQAKAQWGLDEPAAWDFTGGPLEGLDALAAEGVPLLLVLGGADEVVPPHENGERLRDAYRAAGGPVQIWRKPGQGHHPHGLEPVAPLMRAVLVAAGLQNPESEPSVTATPSAEYRGRAAGWGGGTWQEAFASLKALGDAARSEPPMDVVFFGDSITQGLTGHPERMAKPDGERAFDRAQAGRRAVSLGLSGDRTEHLLHRIAEGSLDGFRPRVVVLQIGVNNINAAGHSGAETYRGIVQVVGALRERLPEAKVVIAGPFPAGKDPEGRVRQSIRGVHERLAAHAFDDAVHYLDLAPLFVDEDGAALPTLGRDGIHITEAGREAWMSAIEPTLARLLDGAAASGK